MSQYFRFLLKDPSNTCDELVGSRTDIFFMTDLDGSCWLYMPFKNKKDAEKPLKTEMFEKYEAIDIKQYMDWGVQWSTHCPDYRDYMLHIDLAKYTHVDKSFPILNLKAGPGFGDLSHPTTRLTLAMMADRVKDKIVLDIGSGSGILSLAAILLGAKCAIGVDIDDEAIEHSKENAILNKLEDHVLFVKPHKLKLDPSQSYIIVFNMIRTQQSEAWTSMPVLSTIAGTCITSGILVDERDIYLKECEKRGWQLISEQEQNDWLAFEFEVG